MRRRVSAEHTVVQVVLFYFDMFQCRVHHEWLNYNNREMFTEYRGNIDSDEPDMPVQPREYISSSSLSERIWGLYHNWRHRWCWNQRKCLDCTWGEEGPIKRICNGELFKEEEVLTVGILCTINSVGCNLFAIEKQTDKCVLSLHFSLWLHWKTQVPELRSTDMNL